MCCNALKYPVIGCRIRALLDIRVHSSSIRQRTVFGKEWFSGAKTKASSESPAMMSHKLERKR